jgi:hypothetical protein
MVLYLPVAPLWCACAAVVPMINTSRDPVSSGHRHELVITMVLRTAEPLAGDRR